MEDLRGQHVLVTGATGGLGPTVVQTLLACGATVTAAARRRTALDALRAEVRHHERLHVAESDAAQPAGVEALFDALERGTGPVGAVVHCVGGYAQGPLAETPDAVIETLYRAVFLSTALVTRAALRRMTPRRDGRIVVVGSLASQAPSPDAVVYGALKAAVAHLVRSTAAGARGAGVRINAVLPGIIDTPANRAAMPGADPSRWVSAATVALAIASLLGASGRGIHGSLVELPDGVY